MAVSDNINAVAVALEAVKAHCMCLKFEETETHYRVIYPNGFFPDGSQVHKGMGKAAALNRLADAMERHWKSSML